MKHHLIGLIFHCGQSLMFEIVRIAEHGERDV